MTELSFALERYDRHIPFFMGLVETPPSFDLRALEVGIVPPHRDGVDHHRLMFWPFVMHWGAISLVFRKP